MRHLFLFLAAGALCAQDPIASRDILNQGVQAFQNAQYPERGMAGWLLPIPPTPGPVPDPVMRQDLKTRLDSLLDEGIGNLQKALELNPQHDDAMAYMNLFVRERADLRDTPEEYQRDIAEADQWMRKTL